MRPVKTFLALAVAAGFATAAQAAPVVYNGFTQNPTCSSGAAAPSTAFLSTPWWTARLASPAPNWSRR